MIYRILCLTIVVLGLASLTFAQVPASNHVLLIIEENHSDQSVVGNSAMPYLNSLARRYGYAANYYANSHSSITDYFAITAGQVVETADWTTKTYTQDNIVRHLVQGGKSWKSYAESLPSVGFTGGNVYPYGQNHNPFAYYTDVVNSSTQKANLVPFSQFATDLSSGALPNFSYIVPNQEHNGHDCPDGTRNCSDSTKLSTADSWLQSHIDPLIQSAVFQQDGILVITFDESEGGDNDSGGGRVATIVIGPKVKPGFQSNVFYQHESALKMMMEALGVDSAVGGAKLAPDMADLFGGSNYQAPVSISPPTLFLAYPAVGSTSGSRTATLTNNQSVPLNINAIRASSYYGESDNCPAQLAPGGSCTISVIFTPVTSGIQHGTVAISDDGPDSPHIIYLAGTGTGTGNGTPAPTITSVSPSSGTVAGGTTITIIGSDFLSAPAVTFGGNAATNVVVNSNTQITATIPSHPSGLVDIRIDNSDGQHATLPGAFRYIASGSGPEATLAPTSLDFGGQQIGDSSSAQTITLTNSGGSSMSISGITASGDFLQSNNCGGSLDPGWSCTILVSFTPKHTGARTGAITIADSAPGSPHAVALSGTGTTTPPCTAPSLPGVVVCAPLDGATVTSPVNFVAKATPPSGQTISAMYVYVDDVIVFKTLNTNSVNTNVTVATGAHNVRTQVWDSSGALYKAGSNITVAAGTAPAAVSLSPGSLTFSGQQLGTTSAGQAVTLTNSGGAPLNLSAISASGDFRQANNCPASLNNGVSCNITITFAPTQTGTRSGALTINDSAAGSPHMASLSGTGADVSAAAVTLSPSSLTFSSQTVGTSSTAQPVTLTNSGGSALAIRSIGASGDFGQTNNCPSTLNPNTSCNITVTFMPTQTGSRTGAVSVTDSASGSPHTVAVSGAGTAASTCNAPSAPGVVVCAPFDGATVTSPVSFVAKATPSSGQTISAMYVYVDDVIVYEAVNSNSVNVSVPVATGAHNIRTQVWDSGGTLFKAGSNINVTASGSSAAVTLSSSSLSFNGQQVGTTSASQTVVLTNSGGSALIISGIAASGDFAQSNNCPATLNAGVSCNIAVTFTPSQTGTRTGTVSVTDSATGSPHTVSLTGTGTTNSPAVTLSPSSLSFSGQQTGTTSASQTATLTNSGGSTLTISGIAASGDFAQTNNCASTLNSGASCNISVTFTPSQAGTRTGTIAVTDSASGSPHTVSLSGTGATTPACSAPSAPGVVVCSPSNGATVTSPVNFVAKATPASGETVSAMNVYVDDVSVYKVLNTDSVNINVTIATGAHIIRTQVWDTSGALYKAGSSVTVH